MSISGVQSNKKRYLREGVAGLLFIWILSTAAYASEELSLAQAISLSLKKNTEYKISIEKVRESRLKVRETWGMIWPRFSTDVSYTRMWAEEGMNASLKGQCDIKIISGQLSLNPGTFYHSLQSSYKNHVAAENDVRTIKVDTTIRTIQLYYQMLLAGEIIKLREESIKALEENLRAVTTGYRKGTFSRLDYLRARVSLSNERTKLINARNNLLSVKASLNIHLGRDIHAPLVLDRKALDVDTKTLLFRKGTEKDEKKIVEDMIADALRNRPELLKIKLSTQSIKHTAKSVESVYLWPSLFLNGSYGASKSFKKGSEGSTSSTDPSVAALMGALNDSIAPGGWNQSWSITFGATYQWGALAPFDSSHAKASQLKSAAKQAQLQLELFIKQVKVDVQQKFLKLKSASHSIHSQQGNIKLANEALRVSILQFRSGIIDNSKLLEANVELTTARTLYIEAVHNYQVAQAELNRAIGRDYFPIR